MTNRRDTLKIIGAIGATCTFPYGSDELYGQHIHVPAREPLVTAPVYFGRADFETVSRIADLIIPSTGSPGALQARVPNYIDLVVSRNQEHQPVFRNGLTWIERATQERYGKSFVRLSEAEQIEILTPLCEACDRGAASNAGELFFLSIKNMTADGYYTSKIGLSDELGFKGGAVLAEFPVCEVPEH